jgi:hypothetical protein
MPLTGVPIVDAVLNDHASTLGPDLTGYRNHVYRVMNLAIVISGETPVELEKLAVAAVFHDLGSGGARRSITLPLSGARARVPL